MHYTLLESRFLLSLREDIFALAICFALAYVLTRAMTSQCAQYSRSGRETGTVVVQFVLLLPLLMCTLLMLLQIALLVHAKFVVNYAAFTAVRSAIVVLPAVMKSRATGKIELANEIDKKDRDSPKMQVMRRAAAMACAGISPMLSAQLRMSTGLIPEVSRVLELERVGLLFPSPTPARGMAEQFAGRAMYAFSPRNTKVDVDVDSATRRSGSAGSYGFVTTRVTYRYYLTVPFADRLLGHPYLGSSFFSGTAFYREIMEEYTLPTSRDPLFPESMQAESNQTVEYVD